MPSAAYNSLLTIADKVKLWVTPSRQTFAEIPCLNQPPSPEPQTTTVPLWSEDFFTYCITKLGFDAFPATITYNKVLRTLDETAQAQPREFTSEPNLRAAATKRGYEIDLGHQTIEITGKQWKITDDRDPRAARFHRPIANRPLPAPTQSEKPLAEHLRAAFGLTETKSPQDDPALALAQWLELALRPGTICPPLILTGELNDQAASAIRQLIDPASCNQLPFPVSRREAGWMALYNRVLAFQLIGSLTEFKRTMIKELSQGLFNVRLRQTDHKGPKRFQQVGRPVIIALNQAAVPQICGNQIHIEIHKCDPFPQHEALAALFHQMVRSLRDEPQTQPAPTQAPILVSVLSFANAQANAPFP